MFHFVYTTTYADTTWLKVTLVR